MTYFKLVYLLVVVCFCVPVYSYAGQINTKPIVKKLEALEKSIDGRVGVYAINTANRGQFEYHADERFPMCSTNKVMGVAAILKKSMTVSDFLKQNVNYNKVELADYSPITKKHFGSGMTVAELCAAAIMYSDNTAINLLMKKLGGLDAVNVFAHSIGDNAFRLDRWEPELNTAIPGDLRDTTTPQAMGKSLQKLLLGDVLAPPQRKQFQVWLKNNTTGNSRIRAGVPKGWVVGDKTGTGEYGTTNDIAIVWPSNCPPIILSIYYTQDKKDAAPRDSVISSITHMVIKTFKHTDQCLQLK